MAPSTTPDPNRGAGPRRSPSTPLQSALTVLIAGLLLTVAVAHLEANADRRARRLQFGREAEAIQQQLTARAEELSDQFESATAFIGATHPMPPEVYVDYFQRKIVLSNGVDPGVVLMEEVPVDQLDDLTARERAYGDTDFEVTQLVPTPGDTAMVVTRISVGDSTTPVPLLGYDVAFARNLLLPDEPTSDGYALQVAESSILMSGLLPGSSDALAETDPIPSVSAFFIGEAINADGERVGWALRFLAPQHVTGGITLPVHMNAQLSVEAIETPISVVPTAPRSALDTAELRDATVVQTAGQPWTVEVWADPAFSDGTDLIDQRRQLAIGLGITALLALAAAGWSYYRRRLAGASFELEHARTLATTDHLTGLLNRQGLIDGARSTPATETATLYFVDLDGFKAVNDERGHEAGDAVLTAVGDVLRTSFRHEDLVARLGGDEFVVFTAGRNAEANVRLLADRVIARIGDIDERISCSLGVAHRPAGDGADVKDLLREADEAMYSAKRGGGDRFTVAESRG